LKISAFCFFLFLSFLIAPDTSLSKIVQGKKCFVYFTDKGNVEFNPERYFDSRALTRRLALGIPFYDVSDEPVNPIYINKVLAIAGNSVFISRWFNGIILYADTAMLVKIRRLAFVKEIEMIDHYPAVAKLCSKNNKANEMALLKFQTDRMKGSCFRIKGIDGSGICIAVFDAGFPGVDKSPAFTHLIQNKRIKATYDFVLKKPSVYSHNAHGTMVLSCIAGKFDSLNIGMATGATFLLARTEEALFEPASEEENWLAAVEWADKNGADIINSSLGYSSKRYFNADMNGRKSLVARAAALAAKKGILVVNAAGNEGEDRWKHLVTPADGDSVLAVGGIDPGKDFHISFSSFGPSADKRLKPNVCALGTVMTVGPKGLVNASGTSFSAPLVAGFAACVWQQNRKLKNMEVFRKIEESGHLFPYFDYAHGYGIPQASAFFEEFNHVVTPTFDFVAEADTAVEVHIKEPYFSPKNILPIALKFNLYYSLKDREGQIVSYAVLAAEQKEVLRLSGPAYAHGYILTVHFEGYTQSISLP
jgi:serine protease AprX